MSEDLSIITLVLQASLVVQLVMAGLLVLCRWRAGPSSSASCSACGSAACPERGLRARLLVGPQPAVDSTRPQAGRATTGAPLERIFASGYARVHEAARAPAGIAGCAPLDGARRAMRASFQRELDVDRDATCSFLASVGSVSPLRRPVRHRVGHHARLPSAWRTCSR
jgi:biopolymer transport protein TolQ